MTSIATHIRIFDASPTDELVEKRTTAISVISKGFVKQSSVNDLLRTANDLALAIEPKGTFSDTLGKQIEEAIAKTAVSFVAEKNETQMATCAMLGALQAIDGGASRASILLISDVLALGLWSALSFQKASPNLKLEALRVELMTKAHEVVLKRASTSRTRLAVPDMKLPKPKEGEAESTGLDKSFAEGTRATVDALRANAAVDREELDLLWWVLSDRSDFLGRRFSVEKNPVARALASGLEAGQMLRRMPADAHLHLVLRNLADDVSTFSLPELIKAVESDRQALASKFTDGLIAACPAIFPLLNALLNGRSFDGNAKQKRSLADWAARALLESCILRVTSHLPSVAV